MTALPQGSLAALEPVRRSLREAAQAQAAQIQDEAEKQARIILAGARKEADQIRQAAAAEGEATARSDAALRSARVRRQAHERVLAQQESLHSDLVRQVTEAALALRTAPQYPLLIEQLTKRSHTILGPDATVVESPDGGVIAEKDSRRLDLSLPVLASRMLEPRMPEVRALWAR
jgi:vacuolar-type H+-ATPase subunit E/Vma4